MTDCKLLSCTYRPGRQCSGIGCPAAGSAHGAALADVARDDFRLVPNFRSPAERNAAVKADLVALVARQLEEFVEAAVAEGVRQVLADRERAAAERLAGLRADRASVESALFDRPWKPLT